MTELAGTIQAIASSISPIIVGWLELSSIAGIPIVFGILRKELTLILLADLAGTWLYPSSDITNGRVLVGSNDLRALYRIHSRFDARIQVEEGLGDFDHQYPLCIAGRRNSVLTLALHCGLIILMNLICPADVADI